MTRSEFFMEVKENNLEGYKIDLNGYDYRPRVNGIIKIPLREKIKGIEVVKSHWRVYYVDMLNGCHLTNAFDTESGALEVLLKKLKWIDNKRKLAIKRG